MEPLHLPIRSRPITIRQARVQEIVDLRHRILRAGLPIEEAHFAADAEPATRHVAAFDESSSAVCCATFVLNEWQSEPAFQLRGMATDAAWQRLGLGQAVLQYAIDLVTESSPIRLFWCNARVPALDFYQRQGWLIQSDQFDIPTAGPHRKMMRWVAERE